MHVVLWGVRAERTGSKDLTSQVLFPSLLESIASMVII